MSAILSIILVSGSVVSTAILAAASARQLSEDSTDSFTQAANWPGNMTNRPAYWTVRDQFGTLSIDRNTFTLY